MRLTVTFDYPDELVERYGEKDAAETVAVRLGELYPGPDGEEVLTVGAVDVGLGGWVGQRVYSFGDRETAVAERATVGPRVLRDADPVRDTDVTYSPWTDGRAVGFRCSKDGEPDEYLLLNPSDRGGDTDDAATLFLYYGSTGLVDTDDPITHVEVQR